MKTAMRREPLISAIIPVYNGEAFVADAIRSVLGQGYSRLEVIVMDDGSTDGSEAIVRSFPEATYLRQDNAGVATARNRAIDAAHGELVAFLDQDDEWTPDKIAAQLPAFLDDENVGYSVAMEKIVLCDGITELPFWLKKGADAEPMKSWVPGVLMARRELFETVGRFDPGFVNGSDSDWIVRCRNRGVPCVELDKLLLLRRVHRRNASHRQAVSRRDIFGLLHKAIQAKRAALGGTT